MSMPAIRTQIKTILEGVTGIGVVHDYERWAKDWSQFLTFFKSGSVINGWTVTRTRTEERALCGNQNEQVHVFVIRGYYAVDDSAATEKTFQDLIETIRTTFRTNYTLNGACETTNPEWGSMAGKSGIQADVIEPRMFFGVLCHYCELSLGAQELVDL